MMKNNIDIISSYPGKQETKDFEESVAPIYHIAWAILILGLVICLIYLGIWWNG